MGTEYLFARPNFLSGMAQAIDLGATLTSQYHFSATSDEADRKAIASDWEVTGEEINNAVKLLEAKLGRK